MKIASTIARYLLGFIFLVFGLNGFLHFIPMPPPAGVAGQFLGALFVSHFLVVVFLLQLIPAILLLINRYVPLALTMLAAMLFNILDFHITMAPSGIGLPIFVTLLWFLVAAGVHRSFHELLRPTPSA